MSPWAYVWNIFMFAGCGYVVFGLGHSAWWFVLPLVTFFYPSDDKCKCGSESEPAEPEKL